MGFAFTLVGYTLAPSSLTQWWVFIPLTCALTLAFWRAQERTRNYGDKKLPGRARPLPALTSVQGVRVSTAEARNDVAGRVWDRGAVAVVRSQTWEDNSQVLRILLKRIPAAGNEISRLGDFDTSVSSRADASVNAMSETGALARSLPGTVGAYTHVGGDESFALALERCLRSLQDTDTSGNYPVRRWKLT
jgi:hypothetical protein